MQKKPKTKLKIREGSKNKTKVDPNILILDEMFVKTAFRKDFELNFKDSWDEVSQRVSNPYRNEMVIFNEKRSYFIKNCLKINPIA